MDQALARLLPQHSRSRLQTWVRDGRVQVDGQPAPIRRKIRGGETLHVEPAIEPIESAHRAEDIALKIVFEDETLLVVDKPAGLVVHPGSGNWSGTLLNALLQHAKQLADIPRAGIVHRLDKHTSGLLVIAKTLTAQTHLVRQLQARAVSRDYLAIVYGSPDASGLVDAPIGRHPIQRTKMAVVSKGKAAITHYQVLERFNACSLVRCQLETGRTHQIRVHMQAIGHPLVGDPVYRVKRMLSLVASRFPRQALHAASLAFEHPDSGRPMRWQVELPTDMHDLLTELRRERL